jgi:hypothetical protein
VLDTIANMSLVAIMVIVGPTLLGAGLIYGIASYRRRSLSAKRHTEAVTRNLYRKGAEAERHDK